MRYLLTLLLLLCTVPAWAMEHYTTVLFDNKGNSIKDASVSVYTAGTTTPATLFSDNGVTAKANPFTTSHAENSPGALDFYAANGRYDLVFSKPGVSFNALLTKGIALFDVNDTTAGGITIDTSVVTGGTASSFLYAGAGPVLKQASITGLVKGNGASAPNAATAGTDYAGPSTVNTWGDGIKQTFNPNDTNAGFNVGQNAAAPSAPVDADAYYDGTSTSFQFRENGAWRGLGVAALTDTQQSVFARGKAITGANSLANAFLVGDGAIWTAYYTDATLGYQSNCVVSSVENNCNYSRWLLTGKTFTFLANDRTTSLGTLTSGASSGAWTNMTLTAPVIATITNTGTLTLPTSTDTLVGRATTDTLTNKTLDAEATGNNITLREERHFPVATCQNTTATANFDLAATNTPAPTCDTGTNTQKGYLAFDATTDESFEDNWILPTGFTGAIDVHFRWKAAATSGATGWCAQLIRVADGSTSDPAYPAQASGNCVSDTAKGTTLQENTATISGVTCTSCAAGDHVYVRISRDANGGAVTDDMTGDALLITYGRTIRAIL